MAEELQKEILRLPNLPKSIQGDGRYLMSLLRQSLEDIALQVNIANGFSAEEINPEQGGYPTPRNFFLSFTRLGGTLSWSHLNDISELAYYETRTDTNVGVAYGLLDRTTENTSDNLPVSYSGTIYLYAISKDGTASNPSTLNYTKARPDAPTDIALTTTNEGTLVTFLTIPTDCIGATIYVDGAAYSSVDNIFLLKQERTTIRKVEIAYFDQFGEGERGVLYVTLPDVTGLLVERNGSELDFYWDAINVYGVSYVVRAGREPDWSLGLELFTTKTNDKNRFIYPNVGEYYVMVKVVDGHGNYSKNAAYYFLSNTEDIYRNVILEFDQNEVLYSGNKLNVYYDPTLGGVTLERDAFYGEYIFQAHLPQRYRARNWLEYEPIMTSDSTAEWDDLNLPWDELEHMAWGGELGDLENVSFKQQIAYPKDDDSNALVNSELNGSLNTSGGDEPLESRHADDFQSGRWGDGLYISQLTRLSYSVGSLPKEFSFSFCLKVKNDFSDTVIAVIADDDGNKLEIGYEAYEDRFYVRDSAGGELWLATAFDKERDWLTFAISQNLEERTLFIHSYSKSTSGSSAEKLEPISFGETTILYCYPVISKGE